MPVSSRIGHKRCIGIISGNSVLFMHLNTDALLISLCPPLCKIRSDEVGLQEVDELIRTYRHSCAWFLGPFYNLVRFFHPDYIKPLLLASGKCFTGLY